MFKDNCNLMEVEEEDLDDSKTHVREINSNITATICFNLNVISQQSSLTSMSMKLICELVRLSWVCHHSFFIILVTSSFCQVFYHHSSEFLKWSSFAVALGPVLVQLGVYIYIYLPIYLSIYLSIDRSIYLSIYLSSKR